MKSMGHVVTRELRENYFGTINLIPIQDQYTIMLNVWNRFGWHVYSHLIRHVDEISS